MFIKEICCPIGTECINLARGKLSFQSSTVSSEKPSAPFFANDDNINIEYGANEYCSSTEADPQDVSWWSVDLQSIYSVTKVCLLNTNNALYENLKEFNIFVGDYPNDNKTLCKYVTGPVKQPTATDIAQYDCYFCDSESIGSFLTIKLTAINKKLILCDVDVTGSLINSNRGEGFDSLNIASLKTRNGGNGLGYNIENGYDNNFLTSFHSRHFEIGPYKKPYMLIDALQSRIFHRIIFVTQIRDHELQRFANIYVTANHVPDSDFHSHHKFCIDNLSALFRVPFENINIGCNPPIVGRYLLVIRYDSTNELKYLQFTEIYLYASAIDQYEPQKYGNNLNEFITSGKLENAEMSTNDFNMIKDGVYYLTDNTGIINLAFNNVIVLQTELIYLNYVCLTIFNGNSAKQNMQVKVFDYLKGYDIIKYAYGDFLQSHTFCIKFNFQFSNSITLVSKDSIGLSEIDLIAVSRTTHKVRPRCLQEFEKLTYPLFGTTYNLNSFLYVFIEGLDSKEQVAVYSLKNGEDSKITICNKLIIQDTEWNLKNQLVYQCKKSDSQISVYHDISEKMIATVHIF
ncbi:DgyrCDS14903 [Dimorphilus gyrociliatus]|uniref:DgyrCDS14903 n=1 Tax=Dimorphilus gyrociliatus TaxID=2664684 RepID=A0A7I8WFA1_9ANNE|nr:DgyrCDS14903 [Dimorphilus gyrociliatus]